MQIILLERVAGLGNLGDVVTVKNGYARNFLIPTAKAKRATEANLKEFEARRARLPFWPMPKRVKPSWTVKPLPSRRKPVWTAACSAL